MRTDSDNGAAERVGVGEVVIVEPALVDVQTVSAMLGCSMRHVYRLTDSGRMPQPVRLGRLVRWVRAEVERWISEGCPSCRKGGRR